MKGKMMKSIGRMAKLATLVFVLIAAMPAVFAQEQKPQAIQPKQIILEVSFERPLPASDALQLISSSQGKVTYLMYHWGEHTGWYLLKANQSVEDAFRDFQQQHSDFLLTQIIETSTQSIPESVGGSFKNRRQLETSRARLVQEFIDQLSYFQTNGLMLSGFAVRADSDKLQTIIDSLPKDKVSIRSNAKGAENLQGKSESQIAPLAVSGMPYLNEPWKFSPSSGVISYDAASKYFKSSFIWTDVSGFNSTHSAYEHDITIWNKKDTYVRPGRRAWYSNLPDAYLDTTLFDEYASFTIGTASATKILANNAYYTQVPVEVINESFAPSYGSIQPQLGSWAGFYDAGGSIPEPLEVDFCIGHLFAPAYCVFADQTHTIRDYYTSSSSSKYFPFDHRISSRHSWRKDYNPIPTCPLGQFKGEYFKNQGELVLTQCEPAIDYSWGSRGPGSGVQDDNFLVKWSGQFNFNQGNYRFIATSDDSIQVYIDNVRVIDDWVAHAEREDRLDHFMSGGVHSIRVTYKEIGGQAVAKLRWEFLDGGSNAPTISRYAWNTAPVAQQLFSGTIFGTKFVSGATEVWFCLSGTNNCYKHPAAGVTVKDASTLTVTNVKLAGGSWQVYVKTTGGQSPRSTPFTVQTTTGPTITKYIWNTTPIAKQLFSGTITGTNLVTGNTQVWFCFNNTTACYQHPMAGVTVTSPTSLSVTNVKLDSGSWQIYLKTPAGQSPRSAPFTVQAVPPTISQYTWSTIPSANLPFSGTITGTGFVAGTEVWFCLSNTNTCYQHPAAGVTVNNSSSLSVSNVRLGGGSWQLYVKTPAGSSARSIPFTVNGVVPTISSYTWTTTPMASQPFGGTITGTGFISGGTQVWFCLNGTITCYQQPAAGVTVNSSTSLTVSNVNLSGGSWQIYLKTAAGQSARSTPFNVQAVTLPTINGYLWNTAPLPNQPFGGTLTGTGFVPGGTQVWFCINGTSTCYQQPVAGVSVSNSTSLTLINVNLGAGTWQIYVKTAAGQSARSNPFTIQTQLPSITGYSWNSTPFANQPFSGQISGTGFVPGGTQVWFCINSSSTCYQQPSAGVTVNSATSLSVININLGGGSWQIYVQTAAGQSARSAAFSVQTASPTITGYFWNSTPFANQPFGGTINGTGFVPGATQVWFCIDGTSTCYQQPAAGVNVSNSSSLSVINVNLSGGWWEVYVQTSAGRSGRSSAFYVQAPGPTLTGYSWNTTPVANQPFSGTLNGTGFVPGGTQVWFCIYGTATCYQQPGAGVNVNNSTSLSVLNVVLSSGSWQTYVRTSAGQSARSSAFTVW